METLLTKNSGTVAAVRKDMDGPFLKIYFCT